MSAGRFALLALVACHPAATAPVLEERCEVPRAVGTATVSCAGLRYDVSISPACAKGGCGLILDIPGLSMTARMEEANTRMRGLGVLHGYVVVQPTARAAPKERGLDLPNPRWPVWARGDDELVFAFLQRAIEVLAVDRDRVHATGFSMGGMMTWRLLCRHADVLASVAPAAGTAGCSFAGADAPAREVPILFMHGKSDRLVPFYAARDRRDSVIHAWKMRLVETVALDGHAARTIYRSDKGTSFEFVEHDYSSTFKVDLGGHCFPGSDDPGGEPDQLLPFGCEGLSAFRWGELAVEFFRAHPRR